MLILFCEVKINIVDILLLVIIVITQLNNGVRTVINT